MLNRKQENEVFKIIFCNSLIDLFSSDAIWLLYVIRIVAAILFVIFAGQYYAAKKEELAITFGILAFLFQPLVKISLGREVWNMVDVAVAILLLVLWFKERK